MLKEIVAEIEEKKPSSAKRALNDSAFRCGLRYRVGGEGVWWNGTTQNISSSSLLFEVV